MDIILNPIDSVTARESIGISQAAVSRDTGISRVYISQFESEKRNLEDEQLQTLKNYYNDLGWRPEDTLQEEENSTKSPCHIKIRDGVAVLNSLPEDELEEKLSEIYSTKDSLKTLEEQEIARGFFGGVDDEKAIRQCIKILLHYMKLYQLNASLQGKNPFASSDSIIKTSEQVETNADFVQLIMNNYGITP